MNIKILKGVFLTTLSMFSTTLFAQSVGVGTVTPSPNAALEISQGGQPQGLLIPKMSGVDMGVLAGSLATPADLGMVVYNTDSLAFLYWDGAGFKHFGQGTSISINTGTGLTGGPIGATGTISLENTAVTAGSYGSLSEIPVLSIDAQGRIIGASTVTMPSSIPAGGITSDYLAGNNSWVDFNISARSALSGAGPILYDDGTGVISLDNSGVSSGSYGSSSEIPILSVDAFGRVTSASTVTIPSVLPTGGTTADYLSGDNSWVDFSSEVRNSISAISPLNYNSVTGVISLSNSGVSAGVYGSSAQIAQITIDAQGRITSAVNVTAPSSPWTASGADAYFTGGTIGIGTNSPGYTFEVVGSTGLESTEVAGTFDVTGGLTSLGALDVVGNMAFDGAVQWNDAAFATGSDGLLLSSGTGIMSKLDYSGVATQVLLGNGTWGTISGDDLGNHTATTNLILGSNYLSGDGDNEGLLISADGNVAIGGAVDPNYKLYIYGKLKSDGITEMSDRRLKQDINTLDNSLSKIKSLRGVSYNWNQNNEAGIKFEKELQIGLIAQEVEAVFPELVDTDSEGYKSVEYSKLVAVLIEALKEQEEKIETLESEVGTVQEIKAEVDALKAEMSKYSIR